MCYRIDYRVNEENEDGDQILEDTDTLLINFTDREIVETRDIGRNTLIELDEDGEVVSVTIEHAKSSMDLESLSYRKVPAGGEIIRV